MNLLNSAKWVTLSQSCKILSQLISMIVLARLVVPSEFGLMALAMVVVTFSSLFRDLGTSAAVIQQKEIPQSLLSAIFGLNLAMGLFIAFIILLISPLLAIYFSEPKLTSVLNILAFSFPLMSLGSIHLALLERDLKFKNVAVIEMIATWVSLFVAIFTAYLGWGVYSLVILNMTSAAISTFFLWLISSWRPNITDVFNLSEIKKIFSFSGNLTLFNFVNYFSRNADNIIIGRVFGPTILGFYSLGYRIMLFPLQSMSFVVTRILFPVMSKQQDNNKELFKLYVKVLTLILYLVTPIMLGLVILRNPLIDLIFGANWSLTADIIFWLAPTGIIQAILSTTGSIFMAKGKTKILFFLGILGMILQVSAFGIGSYFDVIVLSKFYFFANVINAIPVMIIVLKLLDGNLIFIMKKFLPVIIINFLTFIFLYIETFFISDIQETWYTFTICILSAITFYLIFSIIFRKKLIFINNKIQGYK